MNDPRLGEWALDVLVGLTVGVLGGLGTAIGWFSGHKERIHKRIRDLELEVRARMEKIEEEVRDIGKIENNHAVQMGILTTCNANISKTLEELKDVTKEQSNKLDALLRTQRGQ